MISLALKYNDSKLIFPKLLNRNHARFSQGQTKSLSLVLFGYF